MQCTYTDYSRICRVWTYSELSDVTQGCLGNITTTREELPPGGWASPGKHSPTHSLHSQAQCHLIGKKNEFYYSAQLRRLSVLCKFLWNFDDVSSCIDSLKMRWWKKSLVVVRVCLAKGSCNCLGIAVISLSLFQQRASKLACLFVWSRDFTMPVENSDGAVAITQSTTKDARKLVMTHSTCSFNCR